MADKSTDPEDPNFDAGLASLRWSMADKLGVDPETGQDWVSDETKDDDEEDDADKHYIPDDIPNDPRPRDDKD